MSASTPKIIMLMYHRIDKVDTDPWGICVSTENFEEQINFLKSNYHIINLNELIEQVSSNNIKHNCICISFDDGYADNFINAKPALEKYNCPSTFFIATAFIGTRKFFWWDELEFIFLQAKQLPAQLSIIIEEEKFEYNIYETLLTQVQYNNHKTWKWFEAPPTQRCEIFLNIWKKLRPLPENRIENYINELKEWSGFTGDSYEQRRTMNKHELSNLSKNNLFAISLHTHTHSDLKDKDKNFQLHEIKLCKESLYNNFGIESNCLAFPYGRYDDTTIDVATIIDIKACFTTEENAITANNNLLKLGRFQVLNWNIDQFKHQLEQWLNN